VGFQKIDSKVWHLRLVHKHKQMASIIVNHTTKQYVFFRTKEDSFKILKVLLSKQKDMATDELASVWEKDDKITISPKRLEKCVVHSPEYAELSMKLPSKLQLGQTYFKFIKKAWLTEVQ